MAAHVRGTRCAKSRQNIERSHLSMSGTPTRVWQKNEYSKIEEKSACICVTSISGRLSKPLILSESINKVNGDSRGRHENGDKTVAK